MSETNFKVGDRVIGVKNWENVKIKGIKGTVIYPQGGTCVEFDKDIGGHNGYAHNLQGKMGHCLYCGSCIELIEEDSTKEEIIIYRKNNEVIATQKRDGKFVDSAKAKCNTTDEFIFLKGAEIAFDRLIGKEDGAVEEVEQVVKLTEYVRTITMYRNEIKKQEETILEKDKQVKTLEGNVKKLETTIDEFEKPKGGKDLIKTWMHKNCPISSGFDKEYCCIGLSCSECWKKAIVTEL